MPKNEPNAAQQKVINHKNGPLLVLAGPGSGKTFVLTERIIQLIQATPNDYFKVLGLTFTVKAANEMKQRIHALLGGDALERVRMQTFHSFCTDFLRQHGSKIGLTPEFSILSDNKDRLAVLNDVDDALRPQGLSIHAPEDTLKTLDIFLQRMINPNELSRYLTASHKAEKRYFQVVYKTYLDTLVQQNLMDFSSLLYFTHKLLQEKPRLKRHTHVVFKYLCVDEFQDTNEAQYKLLVELVGPEHNLLAVADDDQVIFQWNGADPKRLSQFREEFEPALLELPENYRCPPGIVALASRLIAHNGTRFSNKEPAKSQKKDSNAVFLGAFQTFDEELNAIAKKLARIPRKERSECLVIARNNKLLNRAAEHFVQKGLKAEITSRRQDFETFPLQWIQSFLKLAAHPDSRSWLNTLCSTLSTYFSPPVSAEEIQESANLKDENVLEHLVAEMSEWEGGLYTLANTYLQTRDFDTFIHTSLNHFQEEQHPGFEDEKEIWLREYQKIKAVHETINLHTLLQEMEIAPKTPILEPDVIRLQTVHASKGMEFKYVFLLGLAEEMFPSWQAVKAEIQRGKGTSKLIEEERRNCFVAITRASEKLYLSYADEYFGWRKKPSRFIAEMGFEG